MSTKEENVPTKKPADEVSIPGECGSPFVVFSLSCG